MSKQDRQGVRKAADIEQKYGLGQFMYKQNKSNQDMSKGLFNLGESLSAYKEENNKAFETVLNDVSKLYSEISAVKESLENSWQKHYPVGSIYISVSATNPSTLIGGTWERIQDRFLLAAGSSYAAGSTGGEATHTLSVKEMPSHNHAPANRDTAGSDTSYKRQFTTNLHTSSDSTGRVKVATTEASTNYAMTATTASDITGADYTTIVGGGAAHNNMPPYLVVYVWKRTA